MITQTVYFIIFLLIVCIIYFAFAIGIGKRLKRNVETQTVPAEKILPTLPTVSDWKPGKKYKEGLRLGNQRQRRKKFRQSKYLYNKYG